MNTAIFIILIAVLVVSVVNVVQLITLSMSVSDLKTRVKKVELMCDGNGTSVIGAIVELTKIVDVLATSIAQSDGRMN